MTPIEKAREALAKERSRKEEFYEGAVYALKLAEAAQVGESERPKTNGDRVRAMSDEALACLLWNHLLSCRLTCICDTSKYCNKEECTQNILEWLRQEAER